MRDSTYDISRQAGGKLSDRLAENLRKAIATGVLKGGDTLPSIRKMAELCGTSVRVPLAAVGQLQKEGILEAHSRLGIRVLGGSRKLWKGHVLIVVNGGDENFYVNSLNAKITAALVDSDYRVEYVFVSNDGGKRDSCKTLSRMLRNDYDLVIFPDYDAQVVRTVRSSGVPYLVYSTRDFERDENCVGVLVRCDHTAEVAFLDHCLNAGVRRILQVRFENWRGPDLSHQFRQHSMLVESLEMPLPHTFDKLDVVCRESFKAMSDRLTNGRRKLPDLIFFADDFIARGGLWAIVSAGLRIPDDVAVVTMANSGFLPCFPKRLTRLENDTLGNAQIVVRQALRYLHGKRDSVGVAVLDRQYVRGETF